jgi:transposase
MRLFRFHNPARDLPVQELLHRQEQQMASLRQEVAALRQQLVHSDAQVQTLQTENTRLREENAHLREEIARLQRTGKRQAAPFSREQPNPHPKPPGRKPGQGPFTYRDAPAPESFSEPLVQVPVTERVCPRCGGPLQEETVELVSCTDLPQEARPLVKGYRVQVCRCSRCGKRVRGQHPEVAPDQYGATAHRLGARLLSAADVLHYSVGVPMRKVPPILEELTGVSVTQSALTQAALRQSEGVLAPVYEQLRASLKEEPSVYTDDTGWRIGAENAYLMAFETEQASVYQIRRRHRNEEVRELIPSDYPGTLISDRGRSYDAKQLQGVAQQKCLSHLLRSCSQVLASKQGKARWFAATLKQDLRGALQLWKDYRAGCTANFDQRREAMEASITHHLRDRRLLDADNQRLLDEIGRHHDRGNLLRFLNDPEQVEPTNNRAERALRPAVIARKVSHCSQNEAGAEAFSTLVSVLQTLRKRGVPSLVEGLAHLLGSTALSTPPP